MMINLPSVPVAQFCVITTVLVSLACAASGALEVQRPSRVALVAFALVVIALLIALMTNPYPLQQFFYDIYGEMPTYIWLTYPMVFLIAASLPLRGSIRDGLAAVTLTGCLLIFVACIQRFATPWVSVFGSVAFAPVALITVPPLMLGIASTIRRDNHEACGRRSMQTHKTARVAVGYRKILFSPGAARWWRVGALAAAVGIMVFTYGLIGQFCVLLMVAAVAACAPRLLIGTLHAAKLSRIIRIGGILVLVGTVGAVLFMSIPALSGRFVSLDDAATMEQTVGSRLEMWHAAQDMFASRPLTGFGPSGYRLNAVSFLPPQIFARIGQIGEDPTAFSPPSPHSILWEVLTRIGLVGAALVIGAVFLWAREVYTKREEPVVASSLRIASAIAAFAFTATLMVTPFHFASGLIGALCAGLALARRPHRNDENNTRHSDEDIILKCQVLKAPRRDGWSLVRIALFVLCCVVLLGFAYLTFNLVSVARPVESANEDIIRLQRTTRRIPGNPLIERRIIECELMIADSMQESDEILRDALASPGYISGYGPNLVRFAQLGLDNAEYFKSSEVDVIEQVLDRAQKLMPITPVMAQQMSRLEGHH